MEPKTSKNEAVSIDLEAVRKLEKRIARLESIALAHHDLVGRLGFVLHGHQQTIEAIATVAGVPCPEQEIPPMTTLN